MFEAAAIGSVAGLRALCDPNGRAGGAYALSSSRLSWPSSWTLKRELVSIEEAYRRYANYVGAITYRIFGSADEVDDVVQEVFLLAFRHLSELRDEAAMKAWLRTITVRAARDHLRKRRLKQMLGMAGELKPLEEGDAMDEELSPEERGMLRDVYAALDAMPVSRRLCWTLRHIEGHKLEEVAELAGCSLASAKRYISEAQEKLSRRLEGVQR